MMFKTDKCILHGRHLNPNMWETVNPDALSAIRSMLCTATTGKPHSRLFKYKQHKDMIGFCLGGSAMGIPHSCENTYMTRRTLLFDLGRLPLLLAFIMQKSLSVGVVMKLLLRWIWPKVQRKGRSEPGTSGRREWPGNPMRRH